MAKTAKPERVKMQCVNKQAGTVGSIAHPEKKDQAAWEDAGWEVVKEAEKAQ